MSPKKKKQNTGNKGAAKTPEMDFLKRMSLIKKAGVDGIRSPVSDRQSAETIEDLNERIRFVLGIFKNINKRNMIYFIMYDIENNKIRNYIAKYLERKGCVRIQKSVFIAVSERKKYDEIHTTLKEVQEKYENNDSIFIIPVASDHVRAMKVIGHSVDFDMILDPGNTMFF